MRSTEYPYGLAARTYYQAGFSPLPAKGKVLLVTGVSGGYRQATEDEITRWTHQHSTRDILLRLPPTVIALDLDVYKGDLEKLAELEEQLGELPPTWNSDARGGSGGKLLFRVDGDENTRWLSEVGGITVCQHTHRYVMAWPSYNATSQAEYQWYYGLSGKHHPDLIPTVDELAELPQAWQLELRLPDEQPLTQTGPQLPATPDVDDLDACWHMTSLAAEALDALQAAINGNAGLHDTGLAVLGRAIKARNNGHTGFDQVTQALGEVFASAQRADRDLEAEWELAVSYVTARANNLHREQLDPCDIRIIYTPKSQRTENNNVDNLARLRNAGLSLSEARHLLRRGKW